MDGTIVPSGQLYSSGDSYNATDYYYNFLTTTGGSYSMTYISSNTMYINALSAQQLLITGYPQIYAYIISGGNGNFSNGTTITSMTSYPSIYTPWICGTSTSFSYKNSYTVSVSCYNSILSGPGPAINVGTALVPASFYVDTGSSINLQLQNTLSGVPVTLLSCATSGVSINGTSTIINSTTTAINSTTSMNITAPIIGLNGLIIDTNGYMYGSTNNNIFTKNISLNLYPIGYTFQYSVAVSPINNNNNNSTICSTVLSNGVWLISATQILLIGAGTTNTSSYTQANITTSSATTVCTLLYNMMNMPLSNITILPTLKMYFPISNAICTVFNATSTEPQIQFWNSIVLNTYGSVTPTQYGLNAIFTKIA